MPEPNYTINGTGEPTKIMTATRLSENTFNRAIKGIAQRREGHGFAQLARGPGEGHGNEVPRSRFEIGLEGPSNL